MNTELLTSPYFDNSIEAPERQAFETERLVNHVAREIRDALASSCYTDIRQITVDALGPRIVLNGILDSYYHKQLAIESIRQAFEMVEVIDDLRVTAIA
jgi:osmotically-inducible protein OsmY